MKEKELLERIEKLEAKIHELEMRQTIIIVNPAPTITPTIPQPWNPAPRYPGPWYSPVIC